MSLKSIEFSEGGFHFSLCGGSVGHTWERRGGGHVGVCAGHVGCVHGGVDEPVVPVHERGDVFLKDFFDVVG